MSNAEVNLHLLQAFQPMVIQLLERAVTFEANRRAIADANLRTLRAMECILMAQDLGVDGKDVFKDIKAAIETTIGIFESERPPTPQNGGYVRNGENEELLQAVDESE